MKAVIITLVASLGLYAQTAVYPGGIATDSQLKVALNNSQSVLNANINSSVTSFLVGNCSPFVANQLVTIDLEVMGVSSCVGTTMTVTSRPFADSGNVAVSHLTGAAINGWIDSWHHNALRVEVEAIETALGAGLANVASTTTIIPGQYGGTGIANNGKTITLGGNLTTTGAFNLTLAVPATGSYTFPAAGTLIGSADTGTVTNAMLAGSISPSKVTGTSVTQADTATVTNTMLAGSIAAAKLIGSDIATLGTITSGTWHGTVLSPTYGGSGVNNGSFTTTLAGNLTFTGAFNPTFAIGASDTYTFPPANITVSGAASYYCGTSTSCSGTSEVGDWEFNGSVALSSASPSQATITSFSPAFTSTSTYNCTATPEGATAAIAAGGVAVSKVSGSSITLTGPNTVTTVIDYRCKGH